MDTARRAPRGPTSGWNSLAAILLTAIGVYGVISHLVTLRIHEMGIRLALGARPGQVIQLVVREGLGLAIAGIAIEMAGAYVLRRFL